MKVLISTDTSCLVKKGCLDNYDISVYPLNVIINGEEFLDSVTINQEELKDAMRSGKEIKTSTPPLGEIIEYFEKLFAKGYDHIIHFTISSKLSSMNSLFETVANDNFKGKLTVIDSYGISTRMINYVFYAYEQVAKGTSPDDIKAYIDSIKNDGEIVFVPENLTALKNGGRISPTIALVGNLIGIKPVLCFDEGALAKKEMIRNVKKFFVEKIQEFSKTYTIDKYDYTVMNFDGDERVLEYITNHAKEIFPNYNIVEGFLPINVCAHCGPGTLGVIITPKITDKPINEYLK